MAVEPAQAGAHRLHVVRVEHQPRGVALEDREVARPLGDRRDQLAGAGARPDHRHPLALEDDVVVPGRRVEGRAGEPIDAGDVGQPGDVQLPHGADDGVGLDHVLVAVGCGRPDRPAGALVVPHDRAHPGVEADVVGEVVVAHERPEVLQQHGLRGVVEGPLVALGERVAVDVVRVVDPAPGIGVLPPGPADVGVLLEDRERHAGLLEAVGGQQPRHAGADDHDAELAPGRHLVEPPIRRPQVLTRDRQLLLEQREVVDRDGPADGVLHEPVEHLVRRRRRHHAAAVAIAADGVERQVLDGGGLLGRQAGVGLGHAERVGSQVVAQQRQVAGGVGQGRQQRGQHGPLERRPDHVVVVGDRGDRVRRGHRPTLPAGPERHPAGGRHAGPGRRPCSVLPPHQTTASPVQRGGVHPWMRAPARGPDPARAARTVRR